MLLKYSIENYKSIRNKETINFVAKPLTQHKKHLLKDNILPVIVLYGPNGGGKTAILESIKECVAIIIKEDNPFFPTSQMLQSNKNDKKELIKWEFVFRDGNNRELIYNIHFSDKIRFEEFKMKDPLSTIKKEIVVFRKDLNEKGDEVNYLYEELAKTNINLSILNSSKSLLYFFSTIFKNELVESLMKEFKKIEWIDNTFPINKTLTPFNTTQFHIGDVKIIIENKEIILKIFKDLDININDIDIKEDPLNPGSVIVRLCKVDLYENNYWINYNNESNGTQKLIILLAKLIKGIHNKNIFIIDELDSGLHTRILKYLILMFTNNKKNPGAQLIFSSHDMPTLTSDIFRKDEIYFAAINDSRFTSIISLWDFGSDVREANNFSKTYLDGKLGYDPYVDYSLKGFKDCE